MIKAIIAAVILICGTASAEEKKIPRGPVDWKPILGMEAKGGKFYIDANSLSTITTASSRKFNTADLMVVFDKETIAISDKKALMFRSKVHTLVIDCETGLAAPVADLYFKETMPDRSSKPLGGEKYPADPIHTMYHVDKKSVIYNVLCPNII